MVLMVVDTQKGIVDERLYAFETFVSNIRELIRTAREQVHDRARDVLRSKRRRARRVLERQAPRKPDLRRKRAEEKHRSIFRWWFWSMKTVPVLQRSFPER